MSLFELSVGFVLSLSWKTVEFFQEREFLIKHSFCSRTWLIGFFEKIASEGGLRNQRLRPARTLRTLESVLLLMMIVPSLSWQH